MHEETIPLSTIRVASSEDILAVERCRYDVYSEEGYIDPAKYPDKREWDEYDGHSISVIATSGPEIYAVGTSRLIFNHEQKLPVQDPRHHSVDTSGMGEVAEVSRLAVRRKWRRPGKIQIGLYRVVYYLSEENGIDTLLIIVDEKFFRTLTWLGFPFEQIGPPANHMGVTIPCACKVADILPSLQESDTANMLGVAEIFSTPFQGQILL